MLLKQIVLFLAGLCAGGIIAAGVFAFLAIIGVFPRLIGKTGTGSHILLYETCVILGGALGNALDLFEFPLCAGGERAQGALPGLLFLALFGLSSGVFVGCLAMSLAETLKAFPVLSRRLRLTVGLPFLILAVALGKCAGSALSFLAGIG